MAGQNKDGSAFTSKNTAGSDPSGNKVAETSAITKTAVKPTCGKASVASNIAIEDCNQISIARLSGQRLAAD
jgi:hypothetical protein